MKNDPRKILISKYPAATEQEIEWGITCWELGQTIMAEEIAGVFLKKEDLIKRKKEEFKREVAKFLHLYDRDTLNSFYLYWSEANYKSGKLRWELEKTWETALRLKTWVTRNNKVEVKKEPTDRYKK